MSRYHSILNVLGSSFADTTSFSFDGIDERFQSSSNFTCLDGEGYVGVSFWVKIPNVSAETSYILEIDKNGYYS